MTRHLRSVIHSMEEYMNKKSLGFTGVLAGIALAVSSFVVPAANAASEIVVWADESRGPNLT